MSQLEPQASPYMILRNQGSSTFYRQLQHLLQAAIISFMLYTGRPLHYCSYLFTYLKEWSLPWSLSLLWTKSKPLFCSLPCKMLPRTPVSHLGLFIQGGFFSPKQHFIQFYSAEEADITCSWSQKKTLSLGKNPILALKQHHSSML